MRHPIVTVMYDDDIDDGVLVEFKHTPGCEHEHDEPVVFKTSVKAGAAIVQGIGRVLLADGAQRQDESDQEFGRPAELDDPDRRLN